jgi:hypothetical protein
MLLTVVITIITVKEPPSTACKKEPRCLLRYYSTFKTDIRHNHGFIWFLASRLLILHGLHHDIPAVRALLFYRTSSGWRTPGRHLHIFPS